MKMNIIRVIVVLAMIRIVSSTQTFAQDVCPPSFSPPGGLSLEKVPQFIAFGWDDNNFGDGMNWVVDLFKEKKNPEGLNNLATFDGTPIRSTFFMKGNIESDEAVGDVLDSWKRAYNEGHEIGNHTYNHIAVDIDNELALCDSVLQSIGIPGDEIVGFRTPQLAIVTSVFNALYKLGFLYDCTVEHHTDIVNGEFIWPYTMEKGMHITAFGGLQSSFPGMWELPVYQFTSGLTGFDYNAWVKSSMSGSGYCSLLKEALDHRISTNKCPFLVGTHSDYYASTNTYFESQSSARLPERRKAISDFIDYALSTYQDVRIVAYEDVIKWMRAPVALDDVTAVHSKPEQVNKVSFQMCNGKIRLMVPEAGKYTFTLYNAKGKQVYAQYEDLNISDAVIIPLARQSFARGVYLLTVSAKGNTRVHKIPVCKY